MLNKKCGFSSQLKSYSRAESTSISIPKKALLNRRRLGAVRRSLDEPILKFLKSHSQIKIS